MTITRLITWLTAVPDHAVRALPETERHKLAAECQRLLKAAGTQPQPPEGLLRDLADGKGRQ